MLLSFELNPLICSKAVCCDDRIHCCPAGYKCTQSECVKAGAATYLRRLSAQPKPDNTLPLKNPTIDPTTTMTCSDNKTICLKSESCCLNQTEQYGCCPLRNVCSCTAIHIQPKIVKL